MNHVKFEIKIDYNLNNTHKFPVFAKTLKEEVDGYFNIPFDWYKFRQVYSKKVLNATKQADPEKERFLREYGTILFNSLLDSEVRSLYEKTKEALQKSETLICFNLKIVSPNLVEIPWELLYDPSSNEFVALSVNTSLVRVSPVPKTTNSLNIEPPLQILGIVSRNESLSQEEIQQRKSQLEESIEELQKKGLIKLIWFSGQTEQELSQAIKQNSFHIIHYIGTAKYDGQSSFIKLSDSPIVSNFISNSQLGRLCSNSSLRLLTLNLIGNEPDITDPLFSKITTSMGNTFPGVITALDINDSYSTKDFFGTLYKALSTKSAVDESFSIARREISYQFKWAATSLYLSTENTNLFFPKNSPVMVPSVTSSLKIFLCHSSQKHEFVLKLYKELKDADFNVWIGDDVLPGLQWEVEIEKQIRQSDLTLVCLTSDFKNGGHHLKQLKIALDIADEQGEESIFIIPVLLEKCEVPQKLKHLKSIEYSGNYELLLKAISTKAAQF